MWPVNVAAGVNANFMAFAVTNLSKQPQAVNVQFYDQNGVLVAEKSTPILAAGQGGDQFFADSQYAGQVIPGGVYAANVKDFLAFTSTQFSGITAATLAKTGTIDGTIMFRGLNGGAIAPLVIRTVGASLTLLLQTPIP